MKSRNFSPLILILIFCFSEVYSQSFSIQKRITIPKSNNAYSFDIIETTPSNFVLIGKNLDSINNNILEERLTLVGLDSNGNTLWVKHYGDTNFLYQHAYFHTRELINRNGHLFASMMAQDSSKRWMAVLLKLKYTGDTIWQKKYYDSANSSVQYFVSSLRPSVDNGFFITGAVQTNTPSFNNHPVVGLFLIKTDSNGTKLWEKRYYKSNLDKTITGRDVIQDPSTRKIVIIGDENYDSGGSGANILILDSVGVIIKQRISALTNHGFSEVIQTKDSNFIMGGGRLDPFQISGFQTNKSSLIKFDIDCNTIFNMEFDTLAISNDIVRLVELPNGDIVTGGILKINPKYNNGVNNIIRILKVDQFGNLQWKKYFDNITDNLNEDNLAGICFTDSKQLAFTSYCYNSQIPLTYMFYRTDTTYCDVNAIACYSYTSVQVENILPKADQFVISPNPCTDQCLIKFSEFETNEQLSLEVLNIFGNVLFSERIIQQEKYILSTNHLPTGIYIIRIKKKNGQITERKLLVL